MNTTTKTEIYAGLTTFLTMAYILLVNPAILSEAGMDKGAVFTATAVTVAIGTFLCGIFSNLPIAIAPALGLNTFFTFMVVQKMGLNWQQALGAVFIAGCVFLVLSLMRIRQWILLAIPSTLHMAIAAGIGLFLGVVGLKELNILIIHPSAGMTLGNLFSHEVALGFLGFMIMAVLDKKNIRGAILISILTVTWLSTLLGYSHFKGFFALPPSLHPTLLQFNFSALARENGLIVIFTFLLVALFDSTGTLIGLLHQAKLKHRQRNLTKALVVEGAATILGSTLGTSTTSPYIESAAGIAAGGRTGLTACVVAGFFLLAIFFAPLAEGVPAYACAPALLYVACKMLGSIVHINWQDPMESIPSILTITMIPLTFSIADGIAIGFLFFIGLKVILGQWRHVQWSSYCLLAVFIIFLYVTRIA